MTELALHPSTAGALRHFIDRPSHAVLLTGAAGIGKGSIARYMAEALLALEPGKLADYAYIRFIAPIDNKAIGIEAIRELEHFLSLIVPGKAQLKRVIIIENSQLMGHEAQNALLKTLEEPPKDTLLILTAPTAQGVLPTIQSRLQIISVTKPAKAVLQQILPAENFESAYIISGGLPGLLQALLSDESHPLLEAVETARQLLSQTSYERLLQVDTLSKNKQLTMGTLTILQQMAQIRLQIDVSPASKRWQNILTTSYEAAEAMSTSSNTKLVLTNLLLNL